MYLCWHTCSSHFLVTRMFNKTCLYFNIFTCIGFLCGLSILLAEIEKLNSRFKIMISFWRVGYLCSSQWHLSPPPQSLCLPSNTWLVGVFANTLWNHPSQEFMKFLSGRLISFCWLAVTRQISWLMIYFMFIPPMRYLIKLMSWDSHAHSFSNHHPAKMVPSAPQALILNFWDLDILSIDVQKASSLCLHPNWWCTFLIHLSMWNFIAYLGGCYFKQLSLNLMVLFRINPFDKEDDSSEGFAFYLIDSQWHTPAHPRQLGHTQCIPRHPNGPLIFSSPNWSFLTSTTSP